MTEQGLPNMIDVTKLLADQSSLTILTFLMDGRFHTVHEIAKVATIKDQTASYHLKRFYNEGWLDYYKRGKFVYYQLSNLDIAHLIEQLMVISPKKLTQSYHQRMALNKSAYCRSCYNHMAGKVGVDCYDYLINSGFLVGYQNELQLTSEGQELFKSLGIDISKEKKDANFIKPCLDWTERRFHLSGRLGRLLLDKCLAEGLVKRNSEDRHLTVTSKGEMMWDELNKNRRVSGDFVE